MSKRKTFHIPLSTDLSIGVQELPLTFGGDTRTLGAWSQHLQELQRAANEVLANNALAGFVADRVMQDMGKRGRPSLVLTPEGEIHLRVSYDQPRRKKVEPVAREARSSNLPKMDELRKQAALYGLDISHLGRKRRAIHELIQAKIAKDGKWTNGSDFTPLE